MAMKKLLSFILIAPLAIACGSLVDDSYDITNLDNSVTLGAGYTISLDGKEFSVKIGDYLDGNSLISANQAGDYSVSMDLGSQQFGLTVPSIPLGDISVPLDMTFSKIDVEDPGIDIQIDNGEYEKTASGKEPISLSVDDFPSEISSISGAEVVGNASLTLKPSALGGAEFILLKEGTEIVFPTWLTGLASSTSGVSVSGSVLTLTRDINFTDNLSIALTFTGISVPEGQGVTSPGKFSLDGELSYVTAMKITYNGMLNPLLSYTPAINGSFSTGSIQVSSATVGISSEISLEEDMTVAIGNLPDILTDGNASLDLYDLVLDMNVDNGIPAPITFSGTLAPRMEDGSAAHAALQLGPYTFNPGPNSIVVNEASDPGFSDIFVPVPYSISFGNLHAGLATTGEITVESGKTYSADASFGIDTPLAFGRNARIGNISTSIDGLNFTDTQQISFSEATLVAQYSNSIPLEFSLSATAQTAEGVNVTVEGPVKIEWTGDTTKELALKVKSSKDISLSDFKGLDVVLSANCTEALEGKPLNRNQSVMLSGFQLKIDSGVTINASK